MDEPGWYWPAWKFGMKRDDLFTKLHDQYNTFSFSIQDPEAFHHDVYEISRDAETATDFHRLMADRQRQRLSELHESLESLAVEIIANPKLMDSEHWQYALQLFRTKSFDSIVRYFASYLPDEYLEHHETASVSSSTFSDTTSVKTDVTSASSVDDDTSLPRIFESDGFIMTKEPLSIHTDIHTCQVIGGPLSPPHSEAMHPDEHSSVDASSDLEELSRYPSRTPSRSMSFSGFESGPFVSELDHSDAHDDDETSQSEDDADITLISSSDCAESRSPMNVVIEDDTVDDNEEAYDDAEDDLDDDYPDAQFPEDDFDYFDSGLIEDDTTDEDPDMTPTPRMEDTSVSCYTQYKTVVSRRYPSPHRRSPSPTPKSLFLHRREGSPLKEVRRSPDEASCKVQKASIDTTRRRPQASRRRVD